MEGFVQSIENAQRQRGGLLRAVAFTEQGELVTAESAKRHAFFQVLAQSRADSLQQRVAQAVAKAFIDVLEVIEVDQK